jgi:glycosyltransferase involved in cell wall biosynthesis
MAPQVSVVIKSYNHADYVGTTLRSVLDQSFQDFEILVTDDGSTDRTVDIIRGFSEPRIALKVFEQNRGISAAMNDLVGRARGEFIAILNSDDFALPGRFARQVEILRANPEIAAVFGLPRAVDEEGKATTGFFDFGIPFSLPDLSPPTILRQFFFNGNFLCGPTAMIRRAVYPQLGPYDPRLAILQDFDMWVRLCAAHKIHILPEELIGFRIRDDNRNASAPRRDTLLSSQFELAQILKRYGAMDRDLLHMTFADDLAAREMSPDARPELWLAGLALTASTPAHWLFALETLFEAATDDAEFVQLRKAAGRFDVFGFQARGERDELGQAVRARDVEVGALRRLVVERDAQLRELGLQSAALSRAVAERQQELAARDEALRERNEVLHDVLLSRSWRYTAPLRRLRQLLARPKRIK